MKTKDIRFLFNAIPLVLIIIAILFEFKPYIGTDPRIDEIKQVDYELVAVKAADIPPLLHATHNKPVMLVIYASWCPACKGMMPVAAEMIRKGELDAVQPVFLSLDNEPRNLSKYLVHGNYHGLFKPYIMDELLNHLPGVMATTGSHYRGAIPYIGFFNSDGKLITDTVDGLNKDQILALIHSLNKQI